MFGKDTIDCLIGTTTVIDGDIHFQGGLRIDGHVKGDVIADAGYPSMLVISDQAKIEGEVRVAHLIINGEVVGPVFSTELLELQPKARIVGDVYYKTLEMHGGAMVSGKLTYDHIGEPVLKLAAATVTTATNKT